MATVSTTTFQVPGSDGGPLRGEVRTSGADERPAVIICHGFKGFKDWGFFPHLAVRLARAGLAAVSFNFSGSGIGPDGERFSEPERFGHATFSGDLRDLALVVQRLLGGALIQGLPRPSSIGLFGHSRGGATALLHAADEPACRALVTWSAIGDVRRWSAETIERWRTDGKIDVVNSRTGEVLPLYTDVLDDIEAHGSGRLDLVAHAGRLRVPWLIVHGDQDESVPLDDARRLYEAADQATTELELIAGGSHTFGARHPWAGSTPELDRAMEATVGWFSRHLD